MIGLFKYYMKQDILKSYRCRCFGELPRAVTGCLDSVGRNQALSRINLLIECWPLQEQRDRLNTHTGRSLSKIFSILTLVLAKISRSKLNTFAS